MKDIFEQDSIRPNAQLLGSTASVPNGHKDLSKDDTFAKVAAPEGGNRDAEGMVHYLLNQSKKPVLFVDSHWTNFGEPCTFSNKQLFDNAVKGKDCVVHQMSVPDQSGTRHLLFLGKSAGLKDADYLECIPSNLANLG